MGVVHAIALLVAGIFLGQIMLLTGRHRLRDRHAFIWVLIGGAAFAAALGLPALNAISDAIGVAYMPSLVFLGCHLPHPHAADVPDHGAQLASGRDSHHGPGDRLPAAGGGNGSERERGGVSAPIRRDPCGHRAHAPAPTEPTAAQAPKASRS